MNWLKGCLVAVSLIVPLPLMMAIPVSAETAAPAAKTEAPKVDANKAAMPTAKADEDKDGESKMSETDKRAKAMECSKQADAKKLHGEARKKFRSACKRGKS